MEHRQLVQDEARQHAAKGLSTLAFVFLKPRRTELLNQEGLDFLIPHAMAVIRDNKFTALKETTIPFKGGGYSITIMLEESHLALHSWPELGFVEIVLHVCDYSRNNYGACLRTIRDIARLFDPYHVAGVVNRRTADDSFRTESIAF